MLMNPAIKYLCTGGDIKKFKVGIIFLSMKKVENVTFIGEMSLFRAIYLEIVVVAVVYLTTNQRHLGYLSSGNGLPGGKIQHSLGSREPMPLGVQGRPVAIFQNKPKAIIKHCAPDAFLFSDPI